MIRGEPVTMKLYCISNSILLLLVTVYTSAGDSDHIPSQVSPQPRYDQTCYREDNSTECTSYKLKGILLIGSTGNGKSTLGNFLLDPSKEHIFGDNQAFTRARDNMPETQSVYHANKIVRYGNEKTLAVTMIDTPGLNEDDVHDLKHMIQIVSTLHSIEHSELSACILVVKFDSKIDAQYKATVRYYRNLLPQLFEKNVFIVMTMFDKSEKAQRDRKMRGIDVDRIKNNAIREIMKSGNLPFQPMLFMMNALPITEEERLTDLKERDSILNYIASLSPTSTRSLRVAKTARLREDDEKAIATINGEIDGYNDRLKELNELAGETLDKIKMKERKAEELKTEIRNLQANLDDYNSSEKVVVETWHFSTPWKFLGWNSEEFDVCAPCDITNVVKWTNGKCQWRNLIEYKNGIKGVLEGNFMRGLYAELRLETMKRLKYAEEVKSLHRRINNKNELLNEVIEALVETESSNKRYKSEIESLMSYIEQCNRKKEIYSQLYMTIEQACERLRKAFFQSIAVCGYY